MQRIFQERREQKRQVKKHVLFNSRPLAEADRHNHAGPPPHFSKYEVVIP